ncbi:hypothetical protein [Pseudoteredinibacter isoporae]|uniref:Uncharacterized protein n=1 Tax=Pseudoteredinibacter isoporae TaxID=570281 RepID=A0A7X0MXE8_9GAMM|nr:hypothetical protein [Pseudoteredinibacter isoporae]MBB6523185.1 hypothetical protein [Pseudoteredinibacter isoporae]NHO88703.1 hypothetical protein [Pseudoteredinibacter isoporae]NIB22606.1 hypothetical protein [Pseudoteredinibacter isoporae]
MDTRIAKLEASCEFAQRDIDDIKSGTEALRSEIRQVSKAQKKDFRILLAALTITTLILFGMITRGFGWM